MQAWLYQDQLEPVAELDGAGNVVACFVYGSRPNTPDYAVIGGATYRIFSDHVGSPRLVVNANTGAVVQRLDYDEFGRITADTNPGLQPFGFAGGLYDPDTKFVRFGARDHDAEAGRWTSKDPLRFDGGPNLFAYAFGDPLNSLDLTGLGSVKNNSSVPIPYKPEKSSRAELIPPGESRDVDVVYSPDGTPNPTIVKIPDTATGEVGPDGELAVDPKLIGDIDRILRLPFYDDRFLPREIPADELDELGFPNPYTGDDWPFPLWPSEPCSG